MVLYLTGKYFMKKKTVTQKCNKYNVALGKQKKGFSPEFGADKHSVNFLLFPMFIRLDIGLGAVF